MPGGRTPGEGERRLADRGQTGPLPPCENPAGEERGSGNFLRKWTDARREDALPHENPSAQKM